jgi:hypothetical protein
LTALTCTLHITISSTTFLRREAATTERFLAATKNFDGFEQRLCKLMVALNAIYVQVLDVHATEGL